MKYIFKSTNGTLNIVLLALLALSASLSFPEQHVENLFTAIVAFASVFREWAKPGIRFKWNSNVFTYISAIVLMLFPFLDKLMPALGDLVNAIVSGSTEKILTAIFLVANIAWQLFQTKPWKQPLAS